MGRWPAPTEAAAILVDVRNPRRVFAAGPSGLFRSKDAGRTWEAIAVGPPEAELVALAQDPRRPQSLFAASADGGLFHSADGGSTWRPVR